MTTFLLNFALCRVPAFAESDVLGACQARLSEKSPP